MGRFGIFSDLHWETNKRVIYILVLDNVAENDKRAKCKYCINYYIIIDITDVLKQILESGSTKVTALTLT